MNNHQKIACPHCGKKDTWNPENVYKPFCSSRCKLIDLGEWASESRKIPGESVDPDNLPLGKNDQNDDEFM